MPRPRYLTAATVLATRLAAYSPSPDFPLPAPFGPGARSIPVAQVGGCSAWYQSPI